MAGSGQLVLHHDQHLGWWQSSFSNPEGGTMHLIQRMSNYFYRASAPRGNYDPAVTI
jgi:hypothetical protein